MRRACAMASASQRGGTRPQSCELCPLLQPLRCFGRPLRCERKFCGKAGQVVVDVDVVEGFCEANGKLQATRAPQQGVERAGGTHAVVFKERWMDGLCPDKVVAAIMRRPDDYVIFVERLEGADDDRVGQMWTITIECDD